MLNLNYQPSALVETKGMTNDEWLKWRTSGIGGSDVAAIYEVSPWNTKRALYYSKIGLEKTEVSNQYTLDFGHAVEDFVAQWFQANFEEYKPQVEFKIGKKIKEFYIYKDTIMYQHPIYTFMNANLDYRFTITTVDDEKIDGVFECKTTSYHIGPEKWANERVPYEYELQTRHYMAVMNLPLTIIACCWGNNVNDYVFRIISRDLDKEEDLIEIEQNFWKENVLKRVPPPLSKKQGVEEENAFKSYRIADLIASGELKELNSTPREINDAIDDYFEAQDKLDMLKAESKRQESIKAANAVKLQEFLKNDNSVVVNGNNGVRFILKNKTRTQSRIDSVRIRKEAPEIYNKYLKTTSTESFSVSKLV